MKHPRPNILVYFSDQQRYDTLGCNGQTLAVTPTLDALARTGINFKHAYTNQPVCGPARAMLQTGLVPTRTGCFRNGIALPQKIPTLARRLRAARYDVAYVGKWHLATTRGQTDYETKPIPPELRGGYDGWWVASDILEFTSHGVGGHLFDAEGQKRPFTGYRTDAVTDHALAFLDTRSADDENPFFLFLSHIEPHHQNDRNRFEGPDGSRERFKGFTAPSELVPGVGDWEEQLPDYLGCCRALDDNLARVIAKLKQQGLFDDTVIIFTSDHGCHFKSHMDELAPGGSDDYKRTCYENTIHIPMVIAGPGFSGGREVNRIVGLLDLPRTIAHLAGASSDGMQGRNLLDLLAGVPWREEAYVQISESFVGRALRTTRYTYCVWAPEKSPSRDMFAEVYTERFLFDNETDPDQKHNRIADPALAGLRRQLASRLQARAQEAGEPGFSIRPA